MGSKSTQGLLVARETLAPRLVARETLAQMWIARGTRARFSLARAGGLSFSVLLAAAGHAQSNRFYTAVDPVEPRTAITGRRQVSLGFNVDSVIPFSRPFVESDPAVENRFQVMSAAALDLGYGLSKNWELGLSIGYSGFESRFARDVGGGKQIESAKFSLFPHTKAMIRYYSYFADGIAAAFETGLGFGFGHVRVETTTGGVAAVESSVKSFGGHLGAGFSFGWAEDYTAHILAGYAFTTLGTNTYSSGTFVVQQRGSLAGAYIRGQLRYSF